MSTTGHGRRRAAGTTTAALLATVLLASCAGAASDQDTTSPTAASSTTASPSEDETTPAASPSASDDDTEQATPGDTPTAGTTVITAPASGAVVDGPTVQVSGEATAFEATLMWEVVPAGPDDDAAAVATDFTQAGANGEVGPFAFSVDLPSGTWTIHVWEPDMSEGNDDAGRRNEATVTVTVR